MACSGDPDPPAADEGTLEALHTLGYVDYTDEEASKERSGTVLWDRNKAAPGYRLYIDPGSCEARLVDLAGLQVHRWKQWFCSTWSYGELLPDGEMLVTSSSRLRRERWNGWKRWSIRDDVHHAQEPLPDGSILALTERRRQLAPERLEPWVNNFDEVREHLDDLWLQDHCLTRISADGDELDSLCLLELLEDNPIGFEIQPNNASFDRQTDEYLVDLFHLNSAQWLVDSPLAAQDPMYEAGNVLISVRNQDSVMILDWDARELRWAWGQGQLAGQHDASLLDDGNILLFDNGVDWTQLENEITQTMEMDGTEARHAERRRVRPSRVIELDPRSGEQVWEFPGLGQQRLNTVARGSAQRLPNGNTLIAASSMGYAVEVTRAGEKVWEFYNPSKKEEKRAAIVLVRHYPAAWVEPFLER